MKPDRNPLAPHQIPLAPVLGFCVSERVERGMRNHPEPGRIRISNYFCLGTYLLSLELTDPGFDFAVRSAFRDRLLAGSAAERLLDTLLARCRALGLLTARGQQRTDAPHVRAAVHVLHR